MKFARLANAFLIFFLLVTILPGLPASAQEELPVYTVQSGDTLGGLSQLFHTPVNRLITANNLANPDVLVPGTSLKIPSMAGLQGEITLQRLQPGDTLHVLSRRLGIPESQLDRINFLTQPESLPLNAQVITLGSPPADPLRLPVTSGMNGLELAATMGLNPWTAVEINTLKGTWDLVQNDTLFLPTGSTSLPEEMLPGVSDFTLSDGVLRQGKTIRFSARVEEGSTLSGRLNGRAFTFVPDSSGSAEAYSGTPRLETPGMEPLILTVTDSGGESYSLLQNLVVKEATSYGVDYPFQVADQLVDPAVTGPETEQVNQVVAPVTPQKYWSGAFRPPSPTPDCITSRFGRLRSYNGSDFIYFHAGLDYCGSTSTPIYAAADGVVVFTGALTVRGNATIIDHGLGVYTGYWHQSEIKVKVGDHVTAGQIIGMVGATGRVTGPHLHFEVFSGGVQVDPTEWLAGDYP
jgi:murein DD-endopeptidase MepM/ murein hydrolase activator NlpD